MRQGIKAFSLDGLQALPKFAILHEIKPDQEDRLDPETYASPNRLRHYIMGFLAEWETGERFVATALFGADPYTRELGLGARQSEAGRRYNPGRPVKAGSIRKRPYGQQWQIIRKLAKLLIAAEAAGSTQAGDSSDRDDASSRPRWPRPRPPIPYSQLWEDRAGYRWLDYRAHLDCSRDYSQISITTDVHIEILQFGARTYFHHFEPLSKRRPHVGASPPVVDFPDTVHPSTPLVHVGRVNASSRHPTWLLDYFDFGIGAQHEEVLHLVFRHSYANPGLLRPLTVPVFVEFDSLDDLRISAICYEGPDNSDQESYSLVEVHPVAGADYHLELPKLRDDKRFLRNPEDFEKTQELMWKSIALGHQLEDIEVEYESYFDYPDGE